MLTAIVNKKEGEENESPKRNWVGGGEKTLGKRRGIFPLPAAVNLNFILFIFSGKGN